MWATLRLRWSKRSKTEVVGSDSDELKDIKSFSFWQQIINQKGKNIPLDRVIPLGCSSNNCSLNQVLIIAICLLRKMVY
jgi:hypothetical protein